MVSASGWDSREPRQETGAVVLDEATNAVDAQLEGDIRANVATVMARGTIIIITHRLETIMSADHVVHLDDGRVVAEGTAAEVLSRMMPDQAETNRR